MKKYISFLLLAVVLISCGDDSDPVNTQTDTFIQPKEGSFFKFDDYDIDTLKSERIPGSTDTTTDTFAKTGMTYMGKTNVSMIITTDKNSTDTFYINYEPNNDITSLQKSGLNTDKWVTYPITSKAPFSLVLSDTTYPHYQTGEPVHSTTTMKITFEGRETISYKGQSVAVVKMKTLFTITSITPSESEVYEVPGFSYFAPSFGYVVKRETPVRTYQNGEKEIGSVGVLIDNLLK